jgi:hypothetical protein
MAQGEGLVVLADLADLDHRHTRLFVQHLLEGDGLAAVGVRARRVAGGIRVRDVLGHDLQARALGVHPAGGDLGDGLERIHDGSPDYLLPVTDRVSSS